MNIFRPLALSAITLFMAGCVIKPHSPDQALTNTLEEVSSASLTLTGGQILLDNDQSFIAKLNAITSATQTLDMAYYIFADDQSSAVLTQAVIDAANRGVKVRLLLDYFSAYSQLDRLIWLENQHPENIEVKLYNRPTEQIIRDAAFFTLSCNDVNATQENCAKKKHQAINTYFSTQSDPLNANYASSGAFLSGLYSKYPPLIAHAVMAGQDIDLADFQDSSSDSSEQEIEQLKALAKIYFNARYKRGLDGLAAKIQLGFVKTFYSGDVDPVLETLNNTVPLTRAHNEQARKDWEFLTEFLHHKLLMVDGRQVVLGGRNIENAYHMQPNKLSDKYVFMDTDLAFELEQPSENLMASFDRLWSFKEMVASLDDVRQHAPNHLLANFSLIEQAQEECRDGNERCVDRFIDQYSTSLNKRLNSIQDKHIENMALYRTEYSSMPEQRAITLPAGTQAYYVENVPFVDGKRHYGVKHRKEQQANKNIHKIWLDALAHTCEVATEENPQQIVWHNAYFFLPANLLEELAKALDGRTSCSNVTVTVLTNSIETTDLNVVNMLATWQLKALADHLSAQPANDNGGASFRYLEYKVNPQHILSLHSKVMVFGDDLYVGSANADVRSLVLDSNNGIYLKDATETTRRYLQTLQQMIDDHSKIADKTQQIGRDSGVLTAEMEQFVNTLLQKYDQKGHLTQEQRAELHNVLSQLTQSVYTLSTETIEGNRKSAEQFNRYFKAI